MGDFVTGLGACLTNGFKKPKSTLWEDYFSLTDEDYSSIYDSDDNDFSFSVLLI